jgi:hypothetical protein
VKPLVLKQGPTLREIRGIVAALCCISVQELRADARQVVELTMAQNDKARWGSGVSSVRIIIANLLRIRQNAWHLQRKELG